MRLAIAGVAAVVSVAAGLAGAERQAGQRAEAFLQDIAVFDVRTGRLLPHHDIVIRGTRIEVVRPTGGPAVAAKYRIDGAGKTALPGFTGTVPVSTTTRAEAGRMLARGITSAWAIEGRTAAAERWQRDLDLGQFYGPRLVGTGTPGGPSTPASERGAAGPDLNILAVLNRLIQVERQSPAAALQEVTIRSAERAGRAADLGAVEARLVADIVIVAGDPLAAISAVERIDAIIFRGDVLTRAHLSLLLAGRLKPGDGQVEPGTR
jgi:cytosine/adenosine deaminase-related metal-dependent hydrolase